MNAATLYESILAEQRAILAGVDDAAVRRLAEAMDGATRVFLYGAGRNGLVLQCFAMRLMHLGLDAHYVGQLAAPAIAKGDVLIVAAALGSVASVDAIARSAKAQGAAIAVFTARRERVPLADLVIDLPGQTMDDPQVSPLLLGGAFELALLLVCERLAIDLKARRGAAPEAIRARHTNLL